MWEKLKKHRVTLDKWMVRYLFHPLSSPHSISGHPCPPTTRSFWRNSIWKILMLLKIGIWSRYKECSSESRPLLPPCSYIVGTSENFSTFDRSSRIETKETNSHLGWKMNFVCVSVSWPLKWKNLTVDSDY